MIGKLMLVNARGRRHQLMFQSNSVSIRRGIANETVWGMPKKTVAVCSGSVHLNFRGVCNLVDTVRCRINTASQSMVDSYCVFCSRRRVIHLYGFMYAPSLRGWPACQIGCCFRFSRMGSRPDRWMPGGVFPRKRGSGFPHGPFILSDVSTSGANDLLIPRSAKRTWPTLFHNK